MSITPETHRTKEGHPDSAHPMIQKLNALVYRACPPTRSRGQASWSYGHLYYYGDSGMLLPYIGQRKSAIYPTWMLGGMTPVGASFVIKYLRDLGHDVTRFERFFHLEAAKDRRAEARRRRLRTSAAAKLTRAERTACGLTSGFLL